MSEPTCVVIGLVILGVVALGVVAMYFGRGLHLKGGDMEMRVSEPKPVPPAPSAHPAVGKSSRGKNAKRKRPGRR